MPLIFTCKYLCTVRKWNMFTKLILDLLPLRNKWVVTLSLWHLKVRECLNVRKPQLLRMSITGFETAVNKTILLPCSYFVHWSAPGASLCSFFLPVIYFCLFVCKKTLILQREKAERMLCHSVSHLVLQWVYFCHKNAKELML